MRGTYGPLRPGRTGYISANQIWVANSGAAYLKSNWVTLHKENASEPLVVVKRTLSGRWTVQMPADQQDWCWARGAEQRKPLAKKAIAIDQLWVGDTLQPKRGSTSTMPEQWTQSRHFQATEPLADEWSRFNASSGLRQYQLTRQETTEFLQRFIETAKAQGDPIEHTARLELARHILVESDMDLDMAGDAHNMIDIDPEAADAHSYWLRRAKVPSTAARDVLLPALGAPDAEIADEAARLAATIDNIIDFPVPIPNTSWLPLLER